MKSYQLTKQQACTFLLLKHGLIGEYRFHGKQGICDFVEQVGCIQFDPIDVCGKNPELVLQSRVGNFQKSMLYELLYQDRVLLDYYDKQLAIILASDWNCFSRTREYFQNHVRGAGKIKEISAEIKHIIAQKGAVCSKDIGLDEKVNWYWSDTKLSRAALEAMYFQGELAIHHKKGSIKYYDLIENCVTPQLLSAKDPFATDFDYLKWQVFRRISAVGLLWNKASDAWLNVNLKADNRNRIFTELLSENKLIEVSVEHIRESLYCPTADEDLLKTVLENPKLRNRCEFIAPLDNLIWDRKLIKALFDFEYRWEIYTPQDQRKYGYYVLPILYGNQFIGRIEVVNLRKEKRLEVKNIWYADGKKPTKAVEKQLQETIKRFAAFNDCEQIDIYDREGKDVIYEKRIRKNI